MDVNAREHLFEEAMADYRQGRFRLAESGLRRLVEQAGSRDPSHLSLYGVVLAHRTRDPRSVAFCQEAVEKNGRRVSLLYLNLARALTACGRRREAVDALNRGLLVHEGDRRLRRELQRLVPRRPPSFPSLGRHHPVNKFLGIARTFGGRLWYGLGSPRRDS
jgi:predicted Zn-dependent protease